MARRNTFIIPLTVTPFSPLSLTNLRLWVKSDTGVTLNGEGVSQWADQSGLGHHLIQDSEGAQPTYVSNQLNGYGTIQFDGVDDKLATTGFTLTQPETVFIIFKTPTFVSGGYVFDGLTGDSGAFFPYSSSPTVFMYAGASFYPITGIVGSYYMATCIYNGTSSIFQANNVAEQSGNAGASNMGGFTVGAYAGGAGYPGNPHIAEIIIMAATATDTERANMKAYVTARYGITM